MQRALVIGAGAIGGTLGAFLARAGHDVTFLTKSEAVAEEIRRRGMSVRGVRGPFTARVGAEHQADRLAWPFDVVMAAVKSYDLAGALRPVLPALPSDCPVVSLQNGICLDELDAVVGPDRAVGCVVAWGATLHGPAETELTSEGELIVGSRSSRGQALAGGVRNLLASAFPARITDNILGEMYSKLVVNSCITTLGAISGQTLGWMLQRRACRSLFIAVMREAMNVADAAQIRVSPFGGRLDYSAFFRGNGFLAHARRHVTWRIIGMKYRRLRSSSLQSLERGRPTEVDSFNGYIVRRGREFGVAAPLNERLVAMVHEIEQGRRTIGPANLEDLS